MADKKGITIIKKKKGGGGHGHHGGAWKVAYADFVTAMMCFFLVMWLMGSDEETRASISHYFNHPNTPWQQGRDPSSQEVVPLGERQGSGDSILRGLNGMTPDDLVQDPVRPVADQYQANLDMSEIIKEMLDGQVLNAEVSIEHLKFSVPDEIFFKRGRHELHGQAPKYLNKLGKLFKGYKGFVKIEGNTDGQPVVLGEFSNDFEFSLARSVSIMNYLVEHNWASEDRIVPIGNGAGRSIASNESAEGRKMNRRIEFTLSFTKR